MYRYQTERSFVFTEEGQVAFLAIRDRANELVAASGAATMGCLMSGAGDSWNRMACVDRLVELGELREIPQEDCAGQHRIFVKDTK